MVLRTARTDVDAVDARIMAALALLEKHPAIPTPLEDHHGP